MWLTAKTGSSLLYRTSTFLMFRLIVYIWICENGVFIFYLSHRRTSRTGIDHVLVHWKKCYSQRIFLSSICSSRQIQRKFINHFHLAEGFSPPYSRSDLTIASCPRGGEFLVASSFSPWPLPDMRHWQHFSLRFSSRRMWCEKSRCLRNHFEWVKSDTTQTLNTQHAMKVVHSFWSRQRWHPSSGSKTMAISE